MFEAEKEEYGCIIESLKTDVENCLYLYMNLINDQKENAGIQVWWERNQQGYVLMKYHDSMQIYCRRRAVIPIKIIELVGMIMPAMISGPDHIIKELEEKCVDYQAAYGKIYREDTYRPIKDSGHIIRASEKYARPIAELICMDQKIGGHYALRDLENQIGDRIRTGTGRSYIIVADGRVVAHTATYAETGSLAVVGGTIIHPDYRDRQYYLQISNYILQELAREDKQVYAFAISEKMMDYHAKMHSQCGQYGKLVKKEMKQ